MPPCARESQFAYLAFCMVRGGHMAGKQVSLELEVSCHTAVGKGKGKDKSIFHVSKSFAH